MSKPYVVLAIWLTVGVFIMAAGLGATFAAAEGVLPIPWAMPGLLAAAAGFVVFMAGIFWFAFRAPTPAELAAVRPGGDYRQFHLAPFGMAYFVAGLFLTPGVLGMMPAGPEQTALFWGWLAVMVFIPAVPRLRAKLFAWPAPPDE